MGNNLTHDFKNDFKNILESHPKLKEYLAVSKLDMCYDELRTNQERTLFTAFLIKADINLLKYVTKIWWGMYSHISGLGVILGDFVIPDHITKIENFAFDGDYTLTSLKVGKGVTDIDPQAFRGCINLEKVELPKHLKDCVWGGKSVLDPRRYTINDIFFIPGATPEIIYY